MTAPGPVEITDLVRGWLPDGGREPIRRDDVVGALLERGQRRGARIAAALPASDDGLLDLAVVDALVLRVHAELQRFTEELSQGRRTAARLRPLLDGLGPGPVRVVDVGCGLGHVIRWLAATGALGPDVELVGIDLDRTLVASAAALAAEEDLPCRFLAADAFARRRHHGPGPDRGHLLGPAPPPAWRRPGGLLRRPDPPRRGRVRALGPGARAVARARAWVFHRARMREPLSRHDGLLSVRRSHRAPELLAAARHPDYDVTCTDPRRALTTQVVRPVVGVRR